MKLWSRLTNGQKTGILLFCAVLLYRQVEFLLMPRSFTAGLLKDYLLLGLYTMWALSLRQRIVSRNLRRVLFALGALIVFWTMVRMYKYHLIGFRPSARRLAWYLYYLPLLFIPLCNLYAAVFVWRPEDYQLSRGLKALVLIPAVLTAAILTNDFHQLAFSFPLGLEQGESEYRYQIVYWLSALWILVAELVSLFILLHKSRTSVKGREKWLPFAALGIGVVYTAAFLVFGQKVVRIIGTMPEVLSFVAAAVCESCIISGLIPSNSRYADLFSASTIAAMIVDSSGSIRYASENAHPVSAEIMQAAAEQPVALDESHLLKSSAIRGGRVLWVADISEINKLLEERRETRQRLAENNDLLKAEIRLRQKRAKIEQENRIYDEIGQATARQTKLVKKILAQTEAEDPALEERLGRICVFSSYIKRRSNLALIAQSEESVPAAELERCIRESADNISAYGIHCFFDRNVEGAIGREQAQLVYDVFEEELENILTSIHSLLIHLDASAEQLQFNMEFDAPVQPVLSIEPKARRLGGSLSCLIEENTGYLHLTLPRGGDPQ